VEVTFSNEDGKITCNFYEKVLAKNTYIIYNQDFDKIIEKKLIQSADRNTRIQKMVEHCDVLFSIIT